MFEYYAKLFSFKDIRSFSEIRQTLLIETNPAMWFSSAYILMLILIAFCFYETFPFAKANLFTLIWTSSAVLIIHTIANYKNYKALSEKYSGSFIAGTYIHAIYSYLPYLLIAVVYDNIVLFSEALQKYFSSVDYSLMKIDGSIFGFQPVVALENYLHPVAVDYFMIAYFLYLVYPYCYIIYLYQKNQLTLFHKVILGQVIMLMVTLVCFVALPAYGPRYAANPQHEFYQKDMPILTKQIEGVKINILKKYTGKESLYQLQYDFWNSIERVKTDCMPSMHAGLCVFCLIYALKSRAIYKWKKTAISFWVIGVTSLVFSTVYLRYHWTIDVIVGLVLAVIGYFFTEFLYKKWLKYRSDNGLGAPEVSWLSEAKRLRGL